MPRRFDLGWKPHLRDPRHLVRMTLGLLLAANLVAAWFVFRTPGGAVEQLELDLAARHKQLLLRQQALERVKKLAEKALHGRDTGDQFLAAHFLPRRNAYSMLEVDLDLYARAAGIRAKERTYNYEPIEGSDTLGMLNINASFEGTYADLIELVNAIDRSKRLLIVEQLQAQPQQGTSVLNITLKLNAFFRMDGPEATQKDLEMVEVSNPGVPAPPAQPPQPAPVIKPAPLAEQPASPPATVPVPPTVSEPRSGPPRATVPFRPMVSEPRSGPPPVPQRTRPTRRPTPQLGKEQ